MENKKEVCGCDKYNFLVLLIWVILILNFPPKSFISFILWGIGLIIPGFFVHFIYSKLQTK